MTQDTPETEQERNRLTTHQLILAYIATVAGLLTAVGVLVAAIIR